MNYRLGVFGFLSHPWLSEESTACASGNYGILDQIAALQWVHRNIRHFGGDPSRVTIGGNSAGATSANILMVSPLARGLFHGAVGMGGSAFPGCGVSDGSPLPAAIDERKGIRFADSLGVRNIHELRELSTERLLEESGTEWKKWAWNACIDGYVLPAPAAELFARGLHNDVPLLVGWTTHEGASLGPTTLGDENRPFQEQIRAQFGGNAELLLKFYPAESDEQARASKLALTGDAIISYPTWAWARAQQDAGNHSVFIYTFGYCPPFPEDWWQEHMYGEPGPWHGAPVIYLFGNFSEYPGWNFSESDDRLCETIQCYLANFVHSGNPNGPILPVWPAYNSGSLPQKMYFAQDISAAVDAELPKFDALGRSLQNSPGSVYYRGFDVESLTSELSTREPKTSS